MLGIPSRLEVSLSLTIYGVLVQIPFKMILFGESQVIEEDLGHVFHHDYSIPKPFHYADGSYNAHRRFVILHSSFPILGTALM